MAAAPQHGIPSKSTHFNTNRKPATPAHQTGVTTYEHARCFMRKGTACGCNPVMATRWQSTSHRLVVPPGLALSRHCGHTLIISSHRHQIPAVDIDSHYAAPLLRWELNCSMPAATHFQLCARHLVDVSSCTPTAPYPLPLMPIQRHCWLRSCNTVRPASRTTRRIALGAGCHPDLRPTYGGQ